MSLGLSAIRKIVVDRCEIGYNLTDDECGFPLIVESDIEDKGDGVFIARFRLPVEKRGALERLAKLVCGDVGSDLHLFVTEKKEYNLPYLDCAWVIVPDELPDGPTEKEQERVSQ